MTATERAVMDALRDSGPLHVGALAAHTHRSPSQVHRAVTRLRQRGQLELLSIGGVLVARRSERAA